jgi:uncharacterized protein
MADPDLRRLVERANPWVGRPSDLPALAGRFLPDRPIPRTEAARLTAALVDARKAHLVVGPRQAGKSTLVWSIVARSPGHLLYLNAEEPLIRAWCRSPGTFGAELDEWLPPGGTLFLEEAQWLDDAGLFLKGLVDARIGRSIVATGSSSFHLLARTRESLAGRATRHRVWPLALDEVAPPDRAAPLAAQRRAAREALDRMLVVGGYPDAWQHDSPGAVLHELVTAFVLRDASDRFRIERPDALRLLLRLAAGQVGDLVNHSEWSRVLGISASTVGDYVALLEETHLLVAARPFIGGRRAELTQATKIYFVDNGLRNAIAGGFDTLESRVDAGKLLENWVFSELHKRFPEPGGVRYWRTRNGAEVDFVIEPTPGALVAVEVKASTGAAGIGRSMYSFIEAYRPAAVLVVYRGEPRDEQVGGVAVRWVPAELLPRALDELG